MEEDKTFREKSFLASCSALEWVKYLIMKSLREPISSSWLKEQLGEPSDIFGIGREALKPFNPRMGKVSWPAKSSENLKEVFLTPESNKINLSQFMGFLDDSAPLVDFQSRDDYSELTFFGGRLRGSKIREIKVEIPGEVIHDSGEWGYRERYAPYGEKRDPSNIPLGQISLYLK